LFSCGFVFRSIAGYVTKNKVADKRKRRLKKPEMKQKGFFIKIKTVSNYHCFSIMQNYGILSEQEIAI